MSSTSSPNGNIFLTTENLAFSMPLIVVCASYAYFKYIPLQYGLPALGGLFVLYQILSQIKAQRAKKLQEMDDKTMDAIAKELGDLDENGTDDAKTKQLKKKKFLVEQRLAAEKRKEEKQAKRNTKKGGAADDDEDDDALLQTFAKGGRQQKKKK